ncbi:MAG TPA: lipopolysaccharide biosynthesis protein [Sphingomicrobium sp.]|nr:lipopolysaccharide biosynthesis protein [Sphingomicrobium sp.]
MKHWFKDQHLRSLLKNSSYLAVSRGVAAICSLATLAMAGRGLGLLLFGMLILITSYAKAASGIAKFQSWQLIVRYGGQGLAAGNPERFKSSTGFAAALDVLSGIVGMIAAVMLLPLLGPLVGIDQEYLWLAMLYCTLLPTMGAATPSGVLRTLDRFDLLSWSSTFTPISRAVLIAIAFRAGAELPVYVAIWFLTDLVGDLYQWFLAWRELRRNDLHAGIRPTLKPTDLPGAWRFAIQINLTVGVQTIWGPIARLAVGGLLGPVGAALFRVASSLADSAQKPADLLGKAFYPEIVRMDLKSKKPWRLMVRSAALATGIAAIGVLILVVGGKPLIHLLFGKDFLDAYEPLMVLMLVPVLGVLSFPLTPMLYALGKSGGPLRAKLIASAVFFLSLAPLSWQFGVVGAAVAFVLATSINVGVMILQLAGEYRQLRAA